MIQSISGLTRYGYYTVIVGGTQKVLHGHLCTSLEEAIEDTFGKHEEGCKDYPRRLLDMLYKKYREEGTDKAGFVSCEYEGRPVCFSVHRVPLLQPIGKGVSSTDIYIDECFETLVRRTGLTHEEIYKICSDKEVEIIPISIYWTKREKDRLILLYHSLTNTLSTGLLPDGWLTHDRLPESLHVQEETIKECLLVFLHDWKTKEKNLPEVLYKCIHALSHMYDQQGEKK